MSRHRKLERGEGMCWRIEERVYVEECTSGLMIVLAVYSGAVGQNGS